MEIEGYSVQKLSEDYEIKEKIGEGSFSIVYKAIHKSDNSIIALKKIKTSNERSNEIEILREFSILQSLDHINIVELQKVLVTEETIYFVMEYIDFDLSNYLSLICGKMEPKLVQSYLYQIFNGIAFCHSRQISHRDLKPSNILIDKKGILKIADFGSAKKLVNDTNNTCVGTRIYCAPELLLNRPYSFGIDIWAIGCIMAEMHGSGRNRLFFCGMTDKTILHKIFSLVGAPDDLPEDMKMSHYQPRSLANIIEDDLNLLDLFSKCLVCDLKKRITAKEALMHPYFGDFSEVFKNIIKN